MDLSSSEERGVAECPRALNEPPPHVRRRDYSEWSDWKMARPTTRSRRLVASEVFQRENCVAR
jgi:hypothetical protein